MATVQNGALIAGKYRLGEIIGSGGMGVVYKATQIELEREVAIKLLLEEYRETPAAVERFFREAKAAARIRGEHVAQVIDVGKSDEGDPYIVMEYLEGEDLGAALRRQTKFPLDLAVTFMLHACSAVADAHAARIIHRDIKPSNLFLARLPNGQPALKVLDFGISRLEDTPSKLTHTSSSIGTAFYMAPEQIERPKTIDQRVDVWALGCVFQEFLVGKPPFGGDALPQIVAAVLKGVRTKPTELDPSLPPAVEDVIGKCLQHDPAKRFQTAAELATALAQLTKIPEHELIARKLRDRAAPSIVPLAELAASTPPPPAKDPVHDAATRPAKGPLPLPIEGAPSRGPAKPGEQSVLSLTQVGGELIETDPKLELDLAPRPPPPIRPPTPLAFKQTEMEPRPRPQSEPAPAPRVLMLDGAGSASQSPAPSPPSAFERNAPPNPELDPALSIDPATQAEPEPERRVVRLLEMDSGDGPKKTPKIDLAVQRKLETQTGDGKPKRRLALWIGGGVVALLAVLLLFVFVGPHIAVSRVHAAAERAGITFTHDTPSVSFSGWELKNVNATFASLPGTTIHAGHARSSFGGAELTLTDVEITSQNPLEDVRRALTSAESALPERVDILEVKWRYAPRPELAFDGSGASFSFKPAPGVNAAQFLSPRTYVHLGSTNMGPFGVNLERTRDISRARIALDPVVPDGPSIIIVDHLGVLHVGAQAPRAALARYGIPPTAIGLHDGDAPDIDMSFEAKADENGQVEGKGTVGLYGLKSGTAAPVDLMIGFSLDGTTNAVRLRGPDSKIGPFPTNIHADWSRSAPAHIAATFQSVNVSCAELARAKAAKQLGVAGVLVTEIAKLSGAFSGFGTVSIAGSASIDLDAPPKVALSWTSSDTCGLVLFAKTPSPRGAKAPE